MMAPELMMAHKPIRVPGLMIAPGMTQVPEAMDVLEAIEENG